jgi:4-amino-4-deoxy-L-arabinose transferase-like glycosyltransferase
VSRWLALLILCGLTFVVGLGHPAIEDADEGFYAESGREMVASGDWITPHFDGEPRTNKPILFYWLIALDYRLTGVNETGARLWSALAGVGLALVAMGITRRWIGAGPDLLAGGIVATSMGLTRLARSALPDVPLAFFVTLAVWAAIEAAQADRPGTRRQQWWLIVAAAAAGLGFLTKGPVAWVLIAVVVAPAVLLERWQTTAKPLIPRIRWSDAGLAALLIVAVTLPWFALATRANGVEFLRSFFVGENVDRFMTDRFNVPQPFWYYLPVIAGGLLPWTPMLLLLVRPLVRAVQSRRLSPAGWRLVVWAAMPVLFFTLSTGKQPRYIVPCLVPIAILIAREAWRRMPDKAGLSVSVVGSLTGLVLIAIGALAYRLGPVFRAADPQWSTLAPSVLVVAGAAVVVGTLVLRRTAAVTVWLVAASIAAVAVEATAYWPTRPEAVERIAERIAAEAPASPVCSCNLFTRNLEYYAGVANVVRDSEPEIQEFLTTAPASLAVVDEVTLNRLEADLHRHFTRLMSVPYLDTARLRVGDLLRNPDPMKVRTVVLVRTP